MSRVAASEAQRTRSRPEKGVTKVSVLQIRADQALVQEIKDRARQQQVSANRFVVEAVRAVLRSEQEKEKEQEWRAGFEAMGRDPDTNNVEYALAAREVVFGE